MTPRHYLRHKTRDPQFLWRMSLGILATGAVIGLVVDYFVPAWLNPDAAAALPAVDQTDWQRFEQLAEQGRWSNVWWNIPPLLATRWLKAPGLTALAFMTGAAWLAFLLQAIQIRSWRDIRLAAPLIGLFVGALSVWPTIFLIYWQEHAWGIDERGDLAGGLRFFILGVALREELCKLLLFVPLLPWLVRRRDELAALVAAGCVGVGFGMEENVGYIGGTFGTATLTRLMMPMPLHMALTGLIGLAAYRACLWPREWGPQLLAVFGVMVLAHGLYNAFSALPALAEYNIATYIIFVLLVYQFFRELRPLLARRQETISLTANFLICITLVASANFIYLAAALGARPAADILVQSIFAQAIMVYLFLREMPEGLIER